MIKASLLPRVATTVAAVVLLPATSALAARTAVSSESTPVDLTGASDQGSHIGGGGSIVRTIVGLAIVIGVIYGVAWVLRQVKASKQPRATGSGLATLASVPLGPNRSVHLVRAGRDLVLLGVAEHGVVPIRTYTEEEAYAAGLIDEDGMLILPEEETSGRARGGDRTPRRLPHLAMPQLALPSAMRAARDTARATAKPPRPATRALPAPRNALDQIRAWTVRS
ncbi:MAG TPA: flagellar biosynthetic protein FliO [Conexibacter sp.]|nr:flagellar biosynthetic protein FliO [Conexibacter sp.]